MMHQLRLSQLTVMIEQTLSQAFYTKSFLVIAETCEIRRASNQHCYFELVEKDGPSIIAKMKAAIWKGNANIIAAFEAATGKRFENNMELLLTVQVRYHTVFGLQLNVTDIDAKYVLGRMEAERQEVLLSLVNRNTSFIQFVEGRYVTKNNLLTLPLVIQRIALITAPQSDGERDFLHEIQENIYGYKFHITPFLTQVQGRDADRLIIQQLGVIAASRDKYDVVVIVRGGGSQTDFSCFDTYPVGRAVAAFPLPVITGIGHERNVCIADMMCFRAVKTPTKAANFILHHNNYFEENLNRLSEILKEEIQLILQSKMTDLETVINFFDINIQKIINQHTHHHEKLELILKYLDPENILNRGFAMVIKDDKIISDPHLIHKDDNIKILLKKSTITSTVTSVT